MSLEQLEHLSLVQKITSEILNHTGLNESVLAEFVISLHKEAKDYSAFKASLVGVGADFPDYFIANLDRLVRTMNPSKPTTKLQSSWADEDLGERKKRNDDLFPGLAGVDDFDRVSKLMDEEIDSLDTMKEFEGLLTLSKGSLTDKQIEKMKRKELRRAEKKRSRDDSHDDRPRKRDASRESRSQSTIDNEPVAFKIYSGTVQSTKSFGAFVKIEQGLRRPAEGMVHISALDNRRVENVEDVVKRGQKVWVKVISVQDRKIGLSMKEVDQRNGEDLAPRNLDAFGQETVKFVKRVVFSIGIFGACC